MPKSLRPPVPSFTSAKRRRFTVGPGTHTAERFPGDTLWSDTWPILLGGKQAGSLSRNLNYGTGATGEPRWQGSLNALRWQRAGGPPVGIGYDVAAFDTAKECLAAWGRSADELLDWAKSEGKAVPKGGPAPRRGSVRRTARRPTEKVERKAPPVPAEPGYTITDARYAKGQKLVKAVPSGTGLKSRAERLIGDGLKGRYTNRERGYVVSPAKAARFEEMYAQGWDASAITGKLEPPAGHAADAPPVKAARPRRATATKANPAPSAQPARRSGTPAYDDLTILPHVIADTVCLTPFKSEFSARHTSAAEVARVEALRQKMTPERIAEFARLVDERCRAAYEKRAPWIMKIARSKTSAGRDQLYIFVAHWLHAFLLGKMRGAKDEAPASRPRRRISAAAIEKAREENPGKYPLPIAEQKLAGLYDYVKREGGKLPPCGK